MTVFWIMAALVAALAGLLVTAGARRGADDAAELGAGTAAAELDELDRLEARGLLAPDAHAAARAEAGRRLLATTQTPVQPLTMGVNDRRWVLGAVGVTVAAALGLYWVTGAPGLPDQTYERRVDQWAGSTETLEPAQVAAVLTREARLQPADAQLETMLGAARFQAGDSIGAASAFRKALAIQPNDARSWARLGESLVKSQDGVVGADAEAAFLQAVKYDPNQLGALFFLGEAALARRDLAAAERWWTPLMANLDPADPRRAELAGRLAQAKAGGAAG